MLRGEGGSRVRFEIFRCSDVQPFNNQFFLTELKNIFLLGFYSRIRKDSMSDIQVNPLYIIKVVYFQPKFWEKVMHIFNFMYFYLFFFKQHQNRIQKKSGVRILKILIILASTGAQCSAKFRKMVKNVVFHVSDPKKERNENYQNLYTTLF